VRDNAERAEFVGYSARHVRFLTLVISAFFAGVSGGLSAINFEIVTAENLGVLRSAGVLLSTFIGGIGHFFGPIIGAVIGVFMTVVLSEYTKAWQLYLGALFILMVMAAPGGIADLLERLFHVARHGKLPAVLPRLLLTMMAVCIAFAGAAMMIDMLYHRTLDAANGPMMTLYGWRVDSSSPHIWLAAAGLLVAGSLAFHVARRPFLQAWHRALDDIAASEGRQP